MWSGGGSVTVEGGKGVQDAYDFEVSCLLAMCAANQDIPIVVYCGVLS